MRTPVKLMSGKVLDVDAEAEAYLRASGLDYTIVRLGGLSDQPADGSAVLSPDINAYSQITRADMASLNVKCAEDDKTVKKTLAAYDPSRVGFLALFGHRSVPVP